jgi:hypothetical protein
MHVKIAGERVEIGIKGGLHIKTDGERIDLKASQRSKDFLVVILAGLAIYTGFLSYGNLKNDTSNFRTDTTKTQFYMKEMNRAKLPAEGIIRNQK